MKVEAVFVQSEPLSLWASTLFSKVIPTPLAYVQLRGAALVPSLPICTTDGMTHVMWWLLFTRMSLEVGKVASVDFVHGMSREASKRLSKVTWAVVGRANWTGKKGLLAGR